MSPFSEESFLPPDRRGVLEPLFSGTEETMIRSCLEGSMGDAWADDPVRPRAALVLTADFGFLAGDPGSPWVRRLGALSAHFRDFTILVPCGEGWDRVIEETWPGRWRRITRYAIRKEPGIFRRERLEALADPPAGFRVEPIGESLYHRLLETDWGRDLCRNLSPWPVYREKGLGFAALWKGEPVSGASSYTVYRGGIEIEVDTRPDFRRRGLARACSARLILACLDRGLYPSWDAANPGSVALAEQLGYRFSHGYPAYEVNMA